MKFKNENLNYICISILCFTYNFKVITSYTTYQCLYIIFSYNYVWCKLLMLMIGNPLRE